MDYPPLPPYLTLTEAAQALTVRLGHEWTGKHVLGCASRGQISVYARIAHVVRLVRVAPIDGEPNEIIGEAGSLPRISAKAMTALLLSDAADFAELTYTRSVDFFGKPELTSVTEWTLAPGELAPRISLDACRVRREGVEQLLSLYGQSKQAKSKPAPAAVVPEPASEPSTNETPEDRDDRRYRELKTAGGDYIEKGGKWSASGPRGLVAKLWKREKANGRPMSDERDVRESLKKAAKRAKRTPTAGPKGNSAFNQ